MLNRRSILKAAAGVVSGVSSVEALDAQKPFMLVCKLDHRVSRHQFASIVDGMKVLLAKTDWPDLPCAILQPGMDLQIIEDPRGAA